MRTDNLQLLDLSPTAPGRVDGGQEQVIRAAVVKKNIGHLVKLYKDAADAKEAVSEAVKKTAEQAGIKASVLRSFVTARAGEDYEKARKKSAQLELLFDEVGE